MTTPDDHAALSSRDNMRYIIFRHTMHDFAMARTYAANISPIYFTPCARGCAAMPPGVVRQLRTILMPMRVIYAYFKS